ncbi:MAG: hypothetical protein DRP11_03555 [Candidatus Aenigmatarchaeota archaeon]|nr:MAG: hypothetical protein DRP11_03555 [Candidatus Aenigmarchaeota archaeon]
MALIHSLIGVVKAPEPTIIDTVFIRDTVFISFTTQSAIDLAKILLVVGIAFILLMALWSVFRTVESGLS